MIPALPTLVAALLTAAAAAAADGALLAAERAAPRPTTDAADERDGVRRTLAFARLLAQLTAGVALGALLGPSREAGGVVLTVLAVLAAVLVVETMARAWGDARGAVLLGPLSPVIRLLGLLLSPVTWVATAVDRASARALPAPADAELVRETTAEQFRQVVAAEAEVTHGEAALLQGVFSLGDTEVHEVMVPRVNIVGIEIEMPWSEVVDRVRSSEHSRFPVYEETLDEIVGLIFAKDLLPSILVDEEPEGGWSTLLRPPTFVPRTKTIGDQLRDFRSSHTHLALVVDEFGGTAGLVTIEDVLEEIVGDIRDEYDEEEPEIVAEEERRYWVAGRVTLEELSELLGEDFEREGITTVGGLVYEYLGRVPRPGERFTLNGFRVVVERVVRRKVERVYFERQEPEPEAEAGS
ncbi:MAG TPA: hemolysin family protein [Gemmatimonadaceae bacterium]|nr:hemolysin family protein [Gemmatimonadaceae bacterium]